MLKAIDAVYASIAHLPDARQWFVCLSGGCDSRALLHMLHSAIKQAPRKWHDIQLTALVVNHNLRQEAAAEADMVARWCAEDGVAVEVLTITQAPVQSGRQEWARTQRYELLLARARRGGGVLWLGHHQDDQAETVAMRLSRHSGFAGLAGMHPCFDVAGVMLLRPLLGHKSKA